MEKRSIDFLPQIDGLRFIAVFGVMIHHWVSQDLQTSYILSNIPFGTGVNLFYVISGFLISFILLGKKDDITEKRTTFLREIKNFYVKRTLRIFPIYYLLIALLCIFSYDTIKGYLVYLLTYTVNWYMVLNDVFIGNQTHLWSLSVEEQFYILWPFIILLAPRRFIFHSIIFVMLVSIASKFFFFYSTYKMGINGATFSCFDSFGLGAIIAYLNYNFKSHFKIKTYRILFYSSIILYVLLFINPMFLGANERWIFLNFGTSVVFFFFVMIASNNGFQGGFKMFLENRTVLYFGKISYGLYLYHNFMGTIYFSGVNQYFPKMKGDADFFIIYFIGTVLMASISWYVIERPVLNLKKYFV